MNTPQYLTQEGMDAIEKKLRQLIEIRRPQIAERLRLSLEEGGDLTENSEYEDAKNEQAFVEGEIVRLETILSSALLIEDSVKRDRVTPGALVTLVDQASKETETFHLVGSAEANPREGKISTESPLGKALMGAKVGDKVKYKAPDGEFVFKIKAIQ
jgi:transcription elongation factor GreA